MRRDVLFEPLDSLFFRDARPYRQGEGQAGVKSRFPPSPTTLVGALRAACARALGWDGHGPWGDSLKPVLGDGLDLGPLDFRGPLLWRDNALLFPAPASLLTAGGEVAARLIPSPRPFACDLGEVRLPLPDRATGDHPRPLANAWLDAVGLSAVLAGGLPPPGSVHRADSLWRHEGRVGISRNADTHATEEGALYAPVQVRLCPGLRLWLGTNGLPDLPGLGAGPVPVGGEGRACWLELTAPMPLPAPASPDVADGRLRYTVHLLTPADLALPLRPEQPVPGLPGRLVSACLPPPVTWGGRWPGAEAHLAVRPHLAAGSVLYLEAKADATEAVVRLHGGHIGERTAWGFGLMAVGCW